MTTKNMLERFLMADMHDCKELRPASKKLIIGNLDVLVKDDDWKMTISKSHSPDLVYEILKETALSGRLNNESK